jgi:hypothetical protein
MKTTPISALNDFKAKKTGIIFATIFGVLQIIMKVLNLYQDSQIVNLLNFIILLSLLIAVYSKEKKDDERMWQIRYFSLKMGFYLLIILLAIKHFFLLKVDTVYLAIGSLVFYLMVFYLSAYFNPAFIFIEKTGNSVFDKVTLKIFSIVMGFLAVIVGVVIIASLFDLI